MSYGVNSYGSEPMQKAGDLKWAYRHDPLSPDWSRTSYYIGDQSIHFGANTPTITHRKA